jgi:hypothetical protein
MLRLRSLLCGALLCLISSVISVADPGDHVVFTPLPAFHSTHNPKWGTVVTDIMDHEAPGDSNHFNDRMTLAHETTHGIHAYIRNHLNHTGRRANGFYVLEDRAVIVPEPNLRKRQIASYVPRSLKGMRYATYVTGQTEWDDTPLYLWDEWNAYVNGAAAGVDLVQSGLWNEPWQDGVAGELEFVAYALATAMAVKAIDPTYFDKETQFTEFLAFNIKRSMANYKVGSLMDAFKWETQDKYYRSLQTSSDAEALREFARDQFGAAWAQEVLGF